MDTGSVTSCGSPACTTWATASQPSRHRRRCSSGTPEGRSCASSRIYMRGFTRDFNPKLWNTPGPIEAEAWTAMTRVLSKPTSPCGLVRLPRHLSAGPCSRRSRMSLASRSRTVTGTMAASSRAFYFNQGNKKPTVQKKVGWLRACLQARQRSREPNRSTRSPCRREGRGRYG